jgi:hypothetical protein
MTDKIIIAVLNILHRIHKQPEFKEAWETMPNAERNYLTGDIYNIIKEVMPDD